MDPREPSGSEGRWLPAAIRRHPLVAFFVLAYAFSWSAELVLFVLLGAPAAVVVPLITFGPTVAAVTVTAAVEGRPGLGRLAARMRLWRIDGRWYLVALVGIPLAYLAGAFVMPGVIGSYTPVAPAGWIIEYAIVLTLGGVIGGPLGEEPGWRGFALPRLQAQLGPLGATFLLGVLWAGWHFPQFLMPEWADQNGGVSISSVAVFVLTVMAICVLMTWIFNHSRASIFLAILAHSSVNTSQVMLNQLFPGAATSDVAGLIGFGVLAIAVLVVTRGHLGFVVATTRPRLSMAAAPART